jgi:hypothetical protein
MDAHAKPGKIRAFKSVVFAPSMQDLWPYQKAARSLGQAPGAS